MNKTFNQFSLSEDTLKFIQLNHFTQPTPIQQEAVPAILKGQDVVGLSRTG